MPNLKQSKCEHEWSTIICNDETSCMKCGMNGLYESDLKQSKWEEGFDDEFPNSRGVFENGDPYGSRRKAIKQFISDLLVDEYRKGYNQAIKDFKIPNEFGEKFFMNNTKQSKWEGLIRIFLTRYNQSTEDWEDWFGRELPLLIEEIIAEQEVPMGVTAWKEYGQKYKYWDYFMEERDKEWLSCLSNTINKTFPRGERLWCIECANRIKKDFETNAKQIGLIK